MAQTAVRIGPRDHGQRMSLEDFNHAEGQEGYLYELGRGKVVVMDVPKLRHGLQVQEIRNQCGAYQRANPKKIHYVAGGMDCKLLIWKLESERHPDVAIYISPPPEDEDDEEVWAAWVPDVAMEVVSPGSSELRNYEEKPEEYLVFGVKEYWVLNIETEELLVHRRVRGRWTKRIVRPGEIYRTRLLPGFDFDCTRVFTAGK
jgi:Uma2 family endonuclease